MSRTQTFEDWLASLIKDVQAAKEKYSFDHELAGHVCEEKELPSYIWKKEGKDKVEKTTEGTFIHMAPLVTMPIKADKILIKVAIDGKDWFTNRDYYVIDLYLDGIGKLVAEHETSIFLNNLLAVANKFEVNVSRLGKAEIDIARQWVRDNGNYADTIIVNPKVGAELAIRQEIIEPWRFPAEFIGKKGSNYIGMLNGADVYWTPLISENVALVYEKREIHLKKTPLTFHFDNKDDSKQLIIEGFRKAWALDDTAVAQVVLKSPASSSK